MWGWSLDDEEHFSKIEKICAGGRAKFRKDSRKMWFVKVDTHYNKSTESIFVKKSKNACFDLKNIWKKFREILTHKFFEKWNFRKKTPKTAFFSFQLQFLKISELKSFQIFLVQSPGIVTQKSEIYENRFGGFRDPGTYFWPIIEKEFSQIHAKFRPSPCANFFDFWKLFPSI